MERILVVGGGIGGLSATIALRKAGYAVDVVEKNPAWDVYGVGIHPAGNALRALQRAGTRPRGGRSGSADARGHDLERRRQIRFADNDWPALVEGLPPGNGITRPACTTSSSHTFESGADVRTGVTFAAIDDTGERVEVEFTDGEQRSYDLVVGADGLDSAVRATCSAIQYPAELTGQVCWRYNLPRSKGLNKIWVWIGETGTAGFCPLSDDLMYILTIEKPPEGEPVRLPTEGLAEIYRRRLAQFGGLVAEHRELIVDDEAVVYRPVENVLLPRPGIRAGSC